MHAFDILGALVRRRILELLADGEQTSGAITDVIRAEFAISQPAVSQHLRVLRDSGFASVWAEDPRRFHAVEPAPLSEVDAWLDRFPPVLGTTPRRSGDRAGPGQVCTPAPGQWGTHPAGRVRHRYGQN
ncbi:ArsR/SmtB family transcription factor [Streptosporangium sp. H16]|uniref:ArsR/SmtB family transcription factor n=1 Tax=Streptosporangium sp. H16 TaxID=3444184 RepID=UPI003F79B3E3